MEALHRAHTTPARLNLVGVTIVDKLISEISTNRMQVTYTIDGYDRCRQRKLPSMPHHKRKLYQSDIYDNDQSLEFHAAAMMDVGVWVRKSRYGDRITFGCFLVSLISSSLVWIWAQYKWLQHGF